MTGRHLIILVALALVAPVFSSQVKSRFLKEEKLSVSVHRQMLDEQAATEVQRSMEEDLQEDQAMSRERILLAPARRMLDEAPSKRLMLEEAPSSRRMLDEAPSSRRMLDEAPSSRRMLDEAAPSKRRMLDEYAPSRRMLDEYAPSKRMLLTPARRMMVEEAIEPTAEEETVLPPPPPVLVDTLCEAGMYWDNDLEVCSACSADCKQCNNGMGCTQCVEGSYLLNFNDCQLCACGAGGKCADWSGVCY